MSKIVKLIIKILIAIGPPPLVLFEFLLLTIIRFPRPPAKPTTFLLGFVTFFLFIFTPFWIKTQLDQLPDPHLLAARDIPVSTKIYDRSGILLYSFYNNENRTIVSLSDLPTFVPAAHIAIEDKNFYYHPGFDPSAIVRAALADTPQGGSTITQQLIKLVLLTPEKTFSRKIKEIILAFWAQRIYSKDQILTMYLNQVPYGGAAYGIESAAQTYFGKHARDLDLAETALLAGLPSAPTLYSPLGANPELAVNRQHQVLEAMLSQGVISQVQFDDAEKEELKFIGLETSIKAPHFVMFVKDYLAQKYGLRTVEQGGLEVITSLDYPSYASTSKLVRDGVAQQKGLNVGNGAALVTNPQTGEILAMVGSTDYFGSAETKQGSDTQSGAGSYFDKTIDGNVNLTTSARSPGSSIKPLNYALALEKNLITPATILDDSPVTYTFSGSPSYSPQNYDGHFHGQISARVALASSYNVPAVKVLEKVGVENFRQFAKNMGITTWEDKNRFGLSLTLGGGEVKMTDLATAYSAFANSGVKVALQPVLKVTDFRGHILEDNTHTTSQAISPQTAFLISSILSDNAARTPTFGPNSALNIPGHTIAVKTGTTETKRDNWTIGYSFGTQPRLVAVWVGNNDNSPMSPALESGNTGAAAIWNPIMSYLLKDQPNSPIPQPEDIISIPICNASESARLEYFRSGTQPQTPCKN